MVNLKHVTSVSMSFSPFAGGSATAAVRLFLNMITSDKVAKTNPSCALKTTLLPPPATPGENQGAGIAVTYKDNKVIKYDPSTSKKILPFLQQLEQHSLGLEQPAAGGGAAKAAGKR